jgi:PAS domain S-box-containing protein
VSSEFDTPKVLGGKPAHDLEKDLEKSIQPQTPIDLLFFQPQILDHLHDSIIITDMEGIITGCNLAASRVFGYTQQDLVGQNVSMFYPPEDVTTVCSSLFQAVKEKGQQSTEMRNRTKSGAEIYIHLTLTLLRDSESQPIGMAGLSQDITERKLTELALRQSDQRFQGLLQVCPDFLFTARNDGWSDWVSKNFYEYTGAETGAPDGMRWSDYLHADDRERVAGKWMAAVKTGNPYESEHRIRRGDGQYRWFRCRAIPIRNSKGNVDRWVGFVTDIQIHKESAAALRQSEKRFEAIFNQMFQFIGLLSVEGILLEANQAALDFGGVTAPEVVGLPFWETIWWTVSPESQKQLQEAVKRAASGEFIRYEVDVHGANNAVLSIDFSIRPITNDAGEVVLLIPEGRDISERKQAENALRESERKFKTLAEAIPHSVWVASREGKAEYNNQRWLDLTGLSMEEALGRGWISAIHPDDVKQTLIQWEKAVSLTQTFEAEFRVKTPTGEYRWQLARSVPHLNGEGEAEKWFGTCTDIHDQKSAMDALSEREATLRNFYDYSPFSMGITELLDDDVRIIYGNPASCRSYGLQPGATSGHTIRGLGASPEGLRSLVHSYNKCLSSGTPVVTEYQRMVEGKRHWFRETIAVLGNTHSENPRFTFVTKDVTVQKLAEETVRKNEWRFRTALENSPVVVFSQDKELRYTWIHNPALGLKAEDVLGKRDIDIFEKREDAEITEELKRSVLEFGVPIRTEVTVHDRGVAREYHLAINPIRSESGEIEGVTCTATEITDRKKAETALQRQQNILQTLMESTDSYIYMKDLEGRYLFVNSSAAESVGKTPEEIIGHDDTFIFPLQHARRMMERDAELLGNGRALVYEESQPMVGGTRYLITSKSLCRDTLGTIIGIVGISRDITDLKNTEHALTSSELNAAGARMAHALAHEINNPLAAITNALYLLRFGPSDFPVEDLLTSAEDALSRITKITRQMIGLYQRSTPARRLKVNEVVEDTLASMDARLRGKTIRLEKVLDGCEFDGIETDIRQLVSVLLDNAVEQSRSQIKIRLHYAKGPGRGFRLLIADDGPGVPVENRGRIFEPFFSTKEERGSGLGLWVARGIAQKYGGSIRLRSSLRKEASGTCVIVEIPMPARFGRSTAKH